MGFGIGVCGILQVLCQWLLLGWFPIFPLCMMLLDLVPMDPFKGSLLCPPVDFDSVATSDGLSMIL